MESSTKGSPQAGGRRAVVSALGSVLLIAGTAYVIVRLALYRLRSSPYSFDLDTALQGVASTAHDTGAAAAATWLVVAALLLSTASWLRRRLPDLSTAEATAAAVVLCWGGTYSTLLVLGPLGLYRPLPLRLLTLAVVFALMLRWRPRRPRRWRGDLTGPAIALGAFALVAGPLMLLQLGSPVSPFMDVLPYVASTEKIVTFQLYDPFTNDAAGLWPQSRQVAGCDGLFSFLALVTGTTGRLATTSLIVPVAALQLLALYLLGRHLGGSAAGGYATLFILQTFPWRRTTDMRGTALAFPLIAIGLVFLLGRRRGTERIALGGTALGLSMTANPLIGLLGMQLGAAATLVQGIDLPRGFVRRVLALAAGSLIAGPQVCIGLGWHAPIPALWLSLAAGLLLAFLLARSPAATLARPPARAGRAARLASIGAAPLAVLYLHGQGSADFFTNDWFGYGGLALFAVCGLAYSAHLVWQNPRRWPMAALPALAVLVGIADYLFAGLFKQHAELAVRGTAIDATPKMIYYWTPYWMVVLTGLWFGMVARRSSITVTTMLVLLLVLYPIRHAQQTADFTGQQLSVVETWGFHLNVARQGYWSGRGHRRWLVDDNWNAIADALRAEIAAGRIAYDTHILHISPSIEAVEAALTTGVSVDLVTPNFNPESIWNVGSRMRGMDAIPAAFAAAPPYVIVDRFPPAQFPELAQYDVMVTRPNVRLYRRR